MEKLATAIPLLAVVLSFFFSGQKKMDRMPNSILAKALGAIVTIEILIFTSVLRPYAKIPNAWSGFGRWIAVTAFISSVIVIFVHPRANTDTSWIHKLWRLYISRFGGITCAIGRIRTLR